MISPKDIIDTCSVEELCKSAESYFKEITNPIPQMAKPFSDFKDSPEILHSLSLLLSGLRCSKGMTILEFGAGTCWLSRFLNQLSCKTISCDVSQSALELGKYLFDSYPIIGQSISEPIFLEFDGHRIELPDNSVDRIICNDAFHHVPNQKEVISEFSRILKKGGIAGFCEPGRNHSKSPRSQSEMRNFDILENDIIINEIFNIAKNSGFTDIRFKIPGNLGLSYTQYKILINPILVKFLNIISPKIAKILSDKTIFFLYKGNYISDSRSHLELSHSIQTNDTQFKVRKSEIIKINLKVTNLGKANWLSSNLSDIGTVKIGTHLYNKENNFANFDFSRHGIPNDVSPNTSFNKTIEIKIDDTGEYELVIDLVSESICWFEHTGSKPVSVNIVVQ